MTESASQGSEGQAVGAAEVGERLSLALGGGFGGACIAIAAAAHAPLSVGLAGVLTLALAGALASIALAPRLTSERVFGCPISASVIGANPRQWSL